MTLVYIYDGTNSATDVAEKSVLQVLITKKYYYPNKLGRRCDYTHSPPGGPRRQTVTGLPGSVS